MFLRPHHLWRGLAFGTLLLYLLGYQPALRFPPIKKSRAYAAELSQSQTVQSQALPQGFILPHPGYLSTRFSFWHPGVDIATGLGMPIHPILDGKVIGVIYDLWGLGHHVIVEHPQGYQSTYGHMGKIYVNVGDQVKQSTLLGEVGMTGHTSGPHTHLEITKDNKSIDPLTVLPSLTETPQAQYLGATQSVGGAEAVTNPATDETLDVKKELKFNL